MVDKPKIDIRTIDRGILSHDLERAEFLLGKSGVETVTGEVARLDTLNSGRIISAARVVLDLAKLFCKKPECTFIKVEVDKTFDEFMVGVYCEDLEVPVGEYVVRTSQVVLANKDVFFAQDVTVRISGVKFYTRQFEQSLGRIDEMLQEAFEKVANRHGETVDEVSRAWYDRMLEKATSQVKIQRGRKDSEAPCVISVWGRKSVFEAGTKEYSMLMAILVDSRNLKRGTFVDDIGDELYDTTGGYNKENRDLMSDTLRNINIKIRKETGLRGDLIVRKGSKYVLNKEITLL